MLIHTYHLDYAIWESDRWHLSFRLGVLTLTRVIAVKDTETGMFKDIELNYCIHDIHTYIHTHARVLNAH